jgi:hypothetical protein
MTQFAQFATFGKPPITLYSNPGTGQTNQATFPDPTDPLNTTIPGLTQLDRTRDSVLAFRLRLWGYVHLTMALNDQANAFLEYDIGQFIPGLLPQFPRVPQVWNEIISGNKAPHESVLQKQGNTLTVTVKPVPNPILPNILLLNGRIELSGFVLTYHVDDSQAT